MLATGVFCQAHLAELWGLRDRCAIGDWHTHIASAQPSAQDLRAWQYSFRAAAKPIYIGVIATEDKAGGGWVRPTLNAWIVREKDGRTVVEKAVIKEEN